MITQAQLQGHWRRNWLRAPGLHDATTRVHWVQAGPWCLDLRVPLVRPLAQAGALAALAAGDLALLLAAEGFAGQITLHDDICTWQRHCNWRGFPAAGDAGRLWFDAAGLLIEDGVHADYREEWQAMPAAPGQTPWQAMAARTATAEGLLIGNDRQFLLGLGHPGAPAWPGLAAALCAGQASPQEAAAVFQSVYVLGHWRGGDGIADLSTQPFCETHAVLRRDAAGARLTLPDFHGRMQEQTLHLTALPA